MKRVLLGLVALATFGCSAGPGTQIGNAAPEIKAENLADGQVVKLADYKGKVVVLDFWATWCGPCIQAMPHLAATQEKYGDKVQILAISNESKKTIDEFLAAKPFKLKFIRDPFQLTQSLYDVTGFPTTFVIGKDGKVAWQSTGFDEEGFDSAIAEAVK